jgi:2-(1,2-epoxy-1,2-dihydrophenyl)acetyl-CoA isomerase
MIARNPSTISNVIDNFYTFHKKTIMPLVLKEIGQGAAFVTLNREVKMNSINREMALLLREILKECESDKNVRAIYLTGKGKAFCAGQDLLEASDTDMMDKILTEQLNPLVTTIRNLQKPVVAAVNGIAAGAGASIALCCDIVVAASSATFTQAFIKIGLIPDSGGTYILPRLVGWQKAAAFMMLGDKISGDEAERLGMIYKSYPDETFKDESMKLALMLARMPTRAIALTKEALNRSVINNFDEQVLCEEELQKIAGKTKDFAEGLKSFMEKRTPEFKGE